MTRRRVAAPPLALSMIAMAAFGGTAVLAVALSRTPPLPALTETSLACQVSSLDAKVASIRTPGKVYYLLEFTNITGQACFLDGYPQVSAYGSTGQIGSPAALDTTIRPGNITLQPRGTAQALLRYTATPELRSAACGQVTAPELRVYLPAQVRPLVLSWQAPACSRPGRRYLEVQPLAPWPSRHGHGEGDG